MIRFLFVAVLLISSPLFAVDDFSAFAEKNCVKCHGAEKQKGDVRLDTLAPLTEDSDVAALQSWQLIVEVLEAGEMPPEKEKTQPAPAQVKAAIRWIEGELTKAIPPIAGLRRMNRQEYENTVHDLLGIDTPLAGLLPEDSIVQGFDNVATGLGISSVLLEKYLEAADAAFEGVIRRIKPLPPETRRATLMDLKENKESVAKQKGGVIENGGAFVDFTPGWPPARIDPAHPVEPGLYRCRAAVFPHDPGEKRTLSVAVFTGPLFGDGERRFEGMFDVRGSAQEPRIIEFTTRMKEEHTMHILPWVFPEHVSWRDKHEKRPGVGILWAETYGPLDQDFPSPAQRKLFGDSETLTMVAADSYYLRHRKGVLSHHVESSAPREDVARIVGDLVERAFRRPLEGDLKKGFIDLALSRLDAGNSFEDSVRAGVTAVLCSPHFLLLNSEPEVDDFTLASRLAYFLWASMPDDELMQLAAAGKLSDSKVRREQVVRMIADPKIERFVENFTGQWLDLRDIEFTTPDEKLYPEFDELLQRSMLAETRGFFRHILTENLSVLNFVDSDFAVVNQRLADHYGLPRVRGHEEFRIVKLPEDSVRGGVLTQGSVLKVTANGTSTSPVLRGVWVLENILGRPALPPPPVVPAVEPDIRGARTIREQLAKHREDESCARCHARIDPPGFALEEFNAIGGVREWYRTVGGEGKRFERTNYQIGPTVEKGAQWPDGRAFADFKEFRAQLMEQPDVIARAMAEKLLVYGCGRPVGAAERSSVDRVVEAARGENFGLRSMIQAVVESELFLRP